MVASEALNTCAGSSPRGRGKRVCAWAVERQEGLIPARAGKSTLT